MKKATLYFLACAFVISFSACSNYNEVMRTNDYDYKYEVAKQYLAEGQ